MVVDTPILEMENLTKIFSRGLLKKSFVLAVDNINLSLNKGDRLAIIGESGMGKTTIARIACLLETPTYGKIKWFGRDIQSLSKKEMMNLRSKVQYVHQDPYTSLHPSKTVFNILADPLKKLQNLKGKKLEDKVCELLTLVGITPPSYFLDKYPHHLSGGGRQRLAIARALTAAPQILVADEPISMIDMSLRASIIQLLTTLNQELQLTVVLVLHDIGAARYFASKGGNLAIIYGGRIVESGLSDEVINNPLHPYTRILIEASPIPDPELAKDRVIPELKSYEPPRREIGEKSCPFSHACLYATDICYKEDPDFTPVKGTHQVACFNRENLPKWIAPWERNG